MKKAFLILISLLVLFSCKVRQPYSFVGRVQICNSNLQVKNVYDKNGHLTRRDYSFADSTKIPYLVATIKIYNQDSLLFNIETDTLGLFSISDINYDSLYFDIRIAPYISDQYSLSYKELTMAHEHTFCLSDTTFWRIVEESQRKKVGYSSKQAQEDITNGNIYLINLTGGASSLNNNETQYLEELFGFKFIYEEPSTNDWELLNEIQNEYNSVVTQYLDSTCNCNFDEEYKKEVIKLIKHRIKHNTSP